MEGPGEPVRTKKAPVIAAATAQADLKQPLRDRIDIHASNMRRFIEKSTPEEGEELMCDSEQYLMRKERDITKRSAGIMLKEEKRLDNDLKKVSHYIKNSDAIANALWVGRTVFFVFAGQLSVDWAFNEINEVLLAVSVAGAAINVYRNRGRESRTVHKEGHKLKRALYGAYHLAEDAFVIHRNNHRNHNGEHNHHAEHYHADHSE